MKFSYTLLKKIFPRIPPRQELVEIFGLRVFEIEGAEGDMIDVKLPANRYSDAASHIGIAREAAAVRRMPFKTPVARIVNAPEDRGLLAVRVEDRTRCPRYSARYFELKKSIGASPAWMRGILKTCGIRPVNAVVDVMNYAMLETGQPLHAFDAEKLAAGGKGVAGAKEIRIIVRNARKGEKIETLDDQKFTLDPGALVIADRDHALALAGIKGGKDSGVTGRTRKIVVEAANFDQATVQKTARRLRIQTDAATRFGHGISPALVDLGLDRATELLKEMGAVIKDTVHVYPRPAGDEIIPFDPAHYERLIGAPIALAETKDFFSRLGFEAKPGIRQGTLAVRIPAWRNDVSIPEDLIEEAARARGYDTLAPRAPLVALGDAHEEDIVVMKERVREFLSHARMDEVYLRSFIPRRDADAARKADGARGADLVELENPLSADFECLRPGLRPGLLHAASANGRFFDDVRLFEIGNAFMSEKKKAREELRLGIVLARKKQPYFYELKGIVADMLYSFGITDVSMVERGARLSVEADHAALGFLAHEELGKGWHAAVAELNLERILALVSEERSFAPLPKYPAVVRDVSLLVGEGARIGDILAAIQAASPAYTADVDLIDEYTDPRMGGKQSITFRIVFQAEDRTLTDAEVNAETEKIAGALNKKFGAAVR